jgi:hypothetical protein
MKVNSGAQWDEQALQKLVILSSRYLFAVVITNVASTYNQFLFSHSHSHSHSLY